MNKEAFLAALREQLSSLSEQDAKESLDYYREIIDDRMEEGLSEEEAVAAVGNVHDIARQILSAVPRPAPTPQKRKLGALEIVLLILGAPIWASLLVAVVSVAVSVYAVIWAALISLYAGAVSVAAVAVAGVFGSVVFLVTGKGLEAMVFLGAGLFCAGFAMLLFMGCNRLAHWLVKGTVWLVRRIPVLWGRKEAAV